MRRFEFMDVLKGLAICGVVLTHCGDWIRPGSEILSAISRHGGRGVQLFFLLSALGS